VSGERFDRDWRLLLAAQAVSTIGTQLTVIALPAIAVLVLGAGIGSATLLLVAEFLPAALLGPLAGVLIDRVRLRGLLVSLDLARMLILAGVAIAIASGFDSIWLLYGLAALLGVAGAGFDAGVETAIPTLVSAARLEWANSVRAGVLNTVRIVGPALGGLAMAAGSAWLPLALDSAAFAVSAVLVVRTRSPRLRLIPDGPVTRGVGGGLIDLRDGLRYVRENLVLRRCVLGTATLNFAGAGIGALFFVFAYDQLHLNSTQVGASFSAFSVGAILGATGAAWLSRRVTSGAACALCAAFAALSLFLIPVATLGWPFAVLTVYQALFGAFATAWATILLSIRQRSTPPRMLGRVSALLNAVTVATIPAGAVVGTALADVLGLTYTMLLLAISSAVTPLFYLSTDFRFATRFTPAPDTADEGKLA
jgi:MFS family permease